MNSKILLLWSVSIFVILSKFAFVVFISQDSHERTVLKGTFPSLWEFNFPTVGFTMIQAMGGEIDVLLISGDDYKNIKDLYYIPIMSAMDVTRSGIPFIAPPGSVFILNNRNFILPIEVHAEIFAFSLPLIIFFMAGVLIVLGVTLFVHKKLNQNLPETVIAQELHDVL